MPTMRDAARMTMRDGGDLDKLPRRAKRRSESRPRASGVDRSASVHASVWRQALALAGGDPSRIEVVSPLEVVVH